MTSFRSRRFVMWACRGKNKVKAGFGSSFSSVLDQLIWIWSALPQFKYCHWVAEDRFTKRKFKLNHKDLNWYEVK